MVAPTVVAVQVVSKETRAVADGTVVVTMERIEAVLAVVTAARVRVAAIDRRTADTQVYSIASPHNCRHRRYHCTPHRPQCRLLRLAPIGFALHSLRDRSPRCRALFPTPPGCTSSPRSSPSMTVLAEAEAEATVMATVVAAMAEAEATAMAMVAAVRAVAARAAEVA